MAERTIFDAYVPKQRRRTEEVSDQISKDPSALQQVGRGIVRGAGDIVELGAAAESLISAPLRQIAGQRRGEGPVIPPGQQARLQAAFEPGRSELEQLQLLLEDDDILPPQRMPGGATALTQALEAIPEGGVVQEAARRGTRSLPGLMGGAGTLANLLRMEAFGLGAKEAVKGLGGGETAQLVADIAGAMVDPRAALRRTGRTTEALEFGRRMGLTERQLTPLVQAETKQKLLAPLAKKIGKTQNQLASTKSALEGVYTELRELPAAQNTLGMAARNNLTQQLEAKLKNMPAKVRETISSDLAQFQGTDMTGNDIIKFYQDVNFNTGPKTKQLTQLKEPLRDALATIDPALSRDFNMANKLYAQYSKISQRLKPQMIDRLLTGTAPLRLLLGLSTGMHGVIYELVGETAARKIASEMLTNPRLQNLSRKAVSSLNAGQVKALEKIIDNYAGEIAKTSPEAAQQLRQLDNEQLQAMMAEFRGQE